MDEQQIVNIYDLLQVILVLTQKNDLVLLANDIDIKK